MFSQVLGCCLTEPSTLWLWQCEAPKSFALHPTLLQILSSSLFSITGALGTLILI